jgi:hypothetical protein
MIRRIRGYLIVGSQYETHYPIVIVMRFDLYLLLSTGCSSDYEIVAQKPNIDPADITTCDFNPIETTRFHEYSCNPILQEELWGQGIVSVGFSVTEVQGHPFYQIWYNSSDIENLSYGLGYAVSTDGTNWTHHPSNPVLTSSPDTWDQDAMSSHIVFWDRETSQYVLAYQGVTLGVDDFDYGSWGMGIATSPDGSTWTKHEQNPVIDFIDDFYRTADAQIRPCWPLTIQPTENGYTGYISASIVGSNTACQMYTLQSTNLIDWSIVSEIPILTSGFSSDRMGFVDASVVEWIDPDSQQKILYMFYVGFSEFSNQGNYQTVVDSKLHIAISYDNGLTWEKDENNPVPIHRSSPASILSVDARVVGSRIHLWVGDMYNNVGGIGYFYYEPNIEPH